TARFDAHRVVAEERIEALAEFSRLTELDVLLGDFVGIHGGLLLAVRRRRPAQVRRGAHYRSATAGASRREAHPSRPGRASGFDRWRGRGSAGPRRGIALAFRKNRGRLRIPLVAQYEGRIAIVGNEGCVVRFLELS